MFPAVAPAPAGGRNGESPAPAYVLRDEANECEIGDSSYRGVSGVVINGADAVNKECVPIKMEHALVCYQADGQNSSDKVGVAPSQRENPEGNDGFINNAQKLTINGIEAGECVNGGFVNSGFNAYVEIAEKEGDSRDFSVVSSATRTAVIPPIIAAIADGISTASKAAQGFVNVMAGNEITMQNLYDNAIAGVLTKADKNSEEKAGPQQERRQRKGFVAAEEGRKENPQICMAA